MSACLNKRLLELQILKKKIPRLYIKCCLQFSILGTLSFFMPIDTFYCIPRFLGSPHPFLFPLIHKCRHGMCCELNGRGSCYGYFNLHSESSAQYYCDMLHA